MRKILTVFAALIMAATLMVPAYATNAEYTYTDTSEYVYLAEGATLYYNPGESSAVYGAVSASLASEQIEVVQICNETEQLCFKHSGVYVWIAPDNVSEDAPEEAIIEISADAEEDAGLNEMMWIVGYLIVGLFWTIRILMDRPLFPLSNILLGWLGIIGIGLWNPFFRLLSEGNWVAWLAVAAACLIPLIVKFTKSVKRLSVRFIVKFTKFVKWLSADS